MGQVITYPDNSVLISTALTVSPNGGTLGALLVPLTLGMMGLPADPNSQAVRLEWAPQGQPFSQPNEDVCYIRCTLKDDDYDKIRDRTNLPDADPNLNEQWNYTRVWAIGWIFYGPNAVDLARAVRSALYQEYFTNALAQSQLFPISEIAEPMRVPEKIGGLWFERADLECAMNEWVTENIERKTIATAEVIVLESPDGQIADVTVPTAKAVSIPVTGQLTAKVSPANGLNGVPTNALVVIQFNEPVNPLTLGQVTLSSASGPVNTTSQLSNGNTLTLTPAGPLTTNTTYTVAIAGVQSVSGDPMSSPVTTNFATGAGPDLTTPTVTAVSPGPGAAGVLTNSVIQLQFSKRVDPLTVTNATLLVSPPVAGNITVSADGLTATLTPSAPMAKSTLFTIQATNGISDLEGHGLAAFLSQFTTGQI